MRVRRAQGKTKFYEEKPRPKETNHEKKPLRETGAPFKRWGAGCRGVKPSLKDTNMT